MGGLAERVQLLVDSRYTGSVNAAARASRGAISQPTLARIVAGRVENPRMEVLRQLAAHFDVSVEWLVTGEGRAPKLPELPPDSRLRTFESYQWAQLVASLELPVEVRRIMTGLPMATVEAVFTLIVKFPAGNNPQGAIDRETPLLVKAMRDERRAWVTLLDEWIRIDGKEKVREAVIAKADLLERRFARPLIRTAPTVPAKRKRSRTVKRRKR